MVQTFLFVFFIVLSGIGVWMIRRKSGNHDADYILKAMGWVLLLIGAYGILDSFRVFN